MLKIPYYPGCTLSTVAKGFDTSAKDSAIKMGFEIEDLPVTFMKDAPQQAIVCGFRKFVS